MYEMVHVMHYYIVWFLWSYENFFSSVRCKLEFYFPTKNDTLNKKKISLYIFVENEWSLVQFLSHTFPKGLKHKGGEAFVTFFIKNL